MRLDESEIWGLYMESKKVGKKKNDAEKNDKKEEGKGKSKKGKIPPQFLNNIKKKKAIKEAWDTKGPSGSEEQEFSNSDYTDQSNGFGKYSSAWNTIEDSVMRVADEEVGLLWNAISNFVLENANEIISKIDNVDPDMGEQDIGDMNDLEPGEEL